MVEIGGPELNTLFLFFFIWVGVFAAGLKDSPNPCPLGGHIVGAGNYHCL